MRPCRVEGLIRCTSSGRSSSDTSGKHNRSVAAHEHHPSNVIPHGAGQHDFLEVPSLPHQVADIMFVTHPDDVLLDDRPFVEVRRDVVAGRADHLHAAIVGGVVRAGPRGRLEGRNDEC